jgi:tRNA1Val (adenine37-N6)-methyltransferase
VEQGKTSMKVCTDSCIFGAYVAMRESEGLASASALLDVGSGTGLLSLMVAQKMPRTKIIAVEKDEGAFLDCQLNFGSSPWSENLTVFHSSFEEFAAGNPEGFERIICNPPFFVNHLRSPDEGRNQSMHNTALEWSIWMQLLSDICHPEGRIWLLLDPGTWDRTVPILGLCGLFVREELTLVQSKGRIWRNIVCLSKEKTDHPVNRFLDVYENQGTLSSDIRHWLHDYYL